MYKGSPTKKEIPIDMNEVDDLLIAGCKGTEIAGYFGVHHDTLYDRVLRETGMLFSEYSAKKRSKGEALIRAQQFAKSIGLTKKGDNMMLIWLGKNRLDQIDTPKQIESTQEAIITQTIDIAKLKAENAELKRMLDESKTGIEYLPSQQEA